MAHDAMGAMEHDAAGPADDMEDTDPGLARERTGMAWTRTAISFAALGGAVLKTTAPAGALVLAMSAVVWGLGRMSRHPRGRENPRWNRHLLITLTVTLVSLVALGVVLLAGNSPSRFRT
jgi:uncharacterized membrane protein YidH (DUF202 family)